MDKKPKNEMPMSNSNEEEDFFPTNEQFERLVHQHAALSLTNAREMEEKKERLSQKRFAKSQRDAVDESESPAPLQTFEPIAPVLFEPSHSDFKKASERRKKKTNFFRARAREAKYKPA